MERISLPLILFFLLFHRSLYQSAPSTDPLLPAQLEWLFFLQVLVGQLTVKYYNTMSEYSFWKINIFGTFNITNLCLKLNLFKYTSCGNVGAAAPTCIALYGASAGYPLRPSPTTNFILPESRSPALSFRTLSFDQLISSSIWSIPTTFPLSPTYYTVFKY